MRAREQALRLMLASAAIPDDGAEATVGRMMAVLDDMDAAMAFMTHWTGGSILALKPGEQLDRWGMTVRLSERAGCDVDFRRELLRNPRYVHCLAIQENLGIKPTDYLWQIDAVDVVEEEPGLHWLIVPACHLGCGTPEVLALPASDGACQACGKPLGPAGPCQRMSPSDATPADRIHDIDEVIVRAIQADPACRERLLADPTEFFSRVCQDMFGIGSLEAFGIREVRVATDTGTTLYLVLLARHEAPSAMPTTAEIPVSAVPFVA